MRIGFYSSKPLEDKRNWSGTMFNIYNQLKLLGYEVEWIPKIELSQTEKKNLKKIEKVFNYLFNRGYSLNVNTYASKCIGKKINKYLKQKNFDIIFVPTYLIDFAYVDTNTPIIYLNDANVAQLINYYPYYSGLGFFSKLEIKFLEKKILNKASKIIYSSDWAKEYTINQYNISKEKVHTLKFGANVTVPKVFNYNKSSEKYTFLFLAVDWERKRGDLAFRSLKILKEKGYPIKMTVIGCNPEIKEDWVEIIPFLNKNNPNDFERLQNYLLHSHFLFVPTKADCTPIAFCEAAGYGLPVISTNTGGVNAHVKDQYNGLLLSAESTKEDYANAIESLLSNSKYAKEMAINARIKYEGELNWDKWGNDFKLLIEELFKKNVS